MVGGTPADSYETWPAIIRYDGVFDWDGMYKIIIGYLRQNNYWFYETLYKSKPWSPTGTELILKWRAERKLDEYYMYHLNFEWHFMDFHHVDVIRDGKKLTLTKSYFYVTIRGKVIQDWQGLENTGHGSWLKTLGKVFRSQVIDREYAYDYIYPLYDEVMDVQKLIQGHIHTESSRTEKVPVGQ